MVNVYDAIWIGQERIETTRFHLDALLMSSMSETYRIFMPEPVLITAREMNVPDRRLLVRCVRPTAAPDTPCLS